MAAKRGKKDLKVGVQQLDNLWEAMVEKHIGAPSGPRSKLSVLFGAIPHLIILGFTIFVVWTAQPSSSLFSWHPTLMSLAFMVLMSEAVLCFSPWSCPLPSTARPTKVRWHWVLQLCSLAAIFTGLAVITTNKLLNGYPHYTTWHGTAGVLLCSVVTLQTAGGVLLLYPEILPFKVRPVLLKRLHAVSGVTTYLGAMATLMLGTYSSWFVANVPNAVLWRTLSLCPPLLAAWTLVQVLRNHFWSAWRK